MMCTVEPRYNNGPWDHENLLLLIRFQFIGFIRVKKQRNIKSWDQQNIPCYKRFVCVSWCYSQDSLPFH